MTFATTTLTPDPVAGPDLLSMAEGFAASAPVWIDRVAIDPTQRTGVRIISTHDYDVWLLRWPPSTGVTPHDHGGSGGAFVVVSGRLTEVRWVAGRAVSSELEPGAGVAVGPEVVHDVQARQVTSFSLHVYAPPLTAMSFFAEDGRSIVETVPV